MKRFDQLTDDELQRLGRRALAMSDAPPGLINRAIGLWPEKAASPAASPADTLRRLVSAVLSFDSWAAGAVPAGMRAVPSDVRHLLFSASGRDVDLRIAPSADLFTVSGQILGPDESGLVELVGQTAADPVRGDARTAALDELGSFRLDAVPRGTYQLTLRVGADDIVLPPIDVGQPRR